MFGRRRLTRVELAVYAVIVATLLVIFASYVLQYMEIAEKAAMETTVNNVTSTINLRYAVLLMRGRSLEAARWTTENPFELAGTFPPNYRGALGAGDALDLERPAWVFDVPRAELVYLPRLHSQLGDGSIDELRFRLERHPSGFGFVLAPTSPYAWNPAASAKNS